MIASQRLTAFSCAGLRAAIGPQLRELGGRNPAREVIDVNDIGDVEPVVADAQPVASGELDDFDGPVVRRAVAVGHRLILRQVSGVTPGARGAGRLLRLIRLRGTRA
jgi:hypothetical protein